MADRLLDEFPPISKNEWLAKVTADLKGKPYDKLVRTNESGIPIAPIYTADDLPEGVDKSFPGLDDLRRNEDPLGHIGIGGWAVAQDYGSTSMHDFDAFVQEIFGYEKDDATFGDVSNCVHAVRVRLSDRFCNAFAEKKAAQAGGGLVIDDWKDLQPILDWARSSSHNLYLELGDAVLDFLDTGLAGKYPGGLDLNPLRFCRNGKPDEALLDALLPKVATAVATMPTERQFYLFTLTLQDLEAAGANAAQQIAFALAMESDLADRLSKHGVEPKRIFQLTSIQLPVTTDFFGEIAKFRALRVLHERMMDAWGIENQGEVGFAQAVPAVSNETIADPHVNLLRHTTQAMAAAIGGCLMLSLPAYDRQYQSAGLDALRTARNIQLILRGESYFGKVIDVAGGAYFVEHLTDALAAKAWAIFQDIEAAGGWYKFVQQDKLGPLLAEGKRKRMAAVSTGAKTILGTNHFPNELETVHQTHFANQELATDSAILKRLQKLGETLGISNPSMDTRRLASDFEAIRLKMQDYKAIHPGVQNALLLTIGDPVMRSARATFARNVLASGGYVCAENLHPSDISAAIASAQTLKPSVVVLCGADADYLDRGGEWLNAVHAALPHAILILAGKPEGWEKLKENGIAEPIFAGMDRIAFLQRLFEQVQQGKEAKA